MENFKWPGWDTVSTIGSGSFGTVYEIQRTVLGQVEKAALKVIQIPKNSSDIDELYSDGYDEESVTSKYDDHLKSIIAEYNLMRQISGCNNVVRCDDVHYERRNDSIGWNIFIKMELLTSLTKSLPAVIPEATVIKMAKDICNALVWCKKYDIIHRDIKPQNLFVSSNGDYKLGDFGIAKSAEKTSYGTLAGTEKYMAPEVQNRQPYGASADIYSLGLVMYWMLNNRRLPFLPTDTKKITFSMEAEAKKRRFSGERIPAPLNGSDALKAIVLKACEFNPKDRYSSAQEMLNALNNINKYSSKQNTTAHFDTALHKKVMDYIITQFKRENNIDLATDKMAVQRIWEAVDKNISQIRNDETVLISLPFITATSQGPLHLEMNVSLNGISGSNDKANDYSSITIKTIINKADNGDTTAMLEVLIRYCIAMYKKQFGINLSGDTKVQNAIRGKLYPTIEKLKNGAIVFFRTDILTENYGNRYFSFDLNWRCAREYVFMMESLDEDFKKSLVDIATENLTREFSQGNYKQAASYCLSVLSYNSKDANALNLLGRCYREMNRADMAVECYKKAIGLSPQNSEIYMNTAVALCVLNQHKEARRYIEKAFEFLGHKDPNRAKLLANAAMIEAELGDIKYAKRLLRKAMAAGYNQSPNYKKAKEYINACKEKQEKSGNKTAVKSEEYNKGKQKLHWDASLIAALFLLVSLLGFCFIMPVGFIFAICYAVVVVNMFINRTY